MGHSRAHAVFQDLVFGYVFSLSLLSLFVDVLGIRVIARSTGDVCYYSNTQYRPFYVPQPCAPRASALDKGQRCERLDRKDDEIIE